MRPRRRRSSTDAAPPPLLRFAVAGARGDAAAGRRAVRAARAARAPRASRRAFEEAALMLVLYGGYPAALEALRVLNDVWPGRARRTREGGRAGWRRRGIALSLRVYGPVHGRLLAAVRTLHPDLAVWMVESGYGRVLSRAGLGVRARELITVAVLAATRRERQLVSHLKGAARVGAPGAEIRRALRAGTRGGFGDALARRAWRAAFGAALTRPSGRP
jgi:4-carboxymuconolactone decarboxylase